MFIRLRACAPLIVLVQSLHSILSLPSQCLSQDIPVFKRNCLDFLRGTVKRNPPANTGDRDSIPGPR